MKDRNWAKPASVTALLLIVFLFIFLVVCDQELRSMITANKENQEDFVRFERWKEIESELKKLRSEISDLKKRVWDAEALILNPKIASINKRISKLEQLIEQLKQEKEKKRNLWWWLNPFN